jgi:two-component system, NarL family, sensor kinase
MSKEQKITLALTILTTLLILILLIVLLLALRLIQKKQFSFKKEILSIKLNYEKEILQTQLEIQEQTLQNISREIHDNISISLTLAKLQLNTLSYADVNSLQKTVISSVNLISKSIVELSDLSKSFNTEAIRENGLYNTLRLEIERIERTGLYQTEFKVVGTPVFMQAQKELILFRIAQEVLNNVLKHAQAKKITISLCYEPNRLVLSITDDGKGFNPDLIAADRKKSMRAGLANIKSRASAIDGSAVIQSIPGNGTIICIEVPYKTVDNFDKTDTYH